MTGIVLNPMIFGSRNDLNIALTELKWIKNYQGKINEEDFKRTSEKYNFPIDFLKKGLEGFSDEDLLIPTSKWFPIIYNWKIQEKEHYYNLLELQADYLKTKYNLMLFFLLYPLPFIYVDLNIFQPLLNLDPFLRLSTIYFSLVLTSIGLYVEKRNNLGNKEDAIEEYHLKLREMGFDYIIDEVEKEIKKEDIRKIIRVMGRKIVKKWRLSPHLIVEHIGTEIKEIKLTRFNKLLQKLHLLPKTKTKEIIPHFRLLEDLHFDYEKRIKELEEHFQNKKGK